MRALPLALLPVLVLSAPVFAAPEVVVTIKPLHSLVAAVMEGVSEPALLVRNAASPHDYALRPSDAEAIERADLVVWTGQGLENFLAGSLDSLAGEAAVLAVSEAPGLTLLPVREGGTFEAHDDSHGHGHDHDDTHGHHGEADMHFWLDPHNAALIVEAVAAELAALDPVNAATYAANAVTTRSELNALAAEIEARLAPFADRPFLVFHDAYQYFEQRFGLTVAGAVTVTPEIMPGARRVRELRNTVAALGATCVFAEPGFQPAIVETIIEGSAARAGVLDPEGTALAEGPDLYPQLLRNLADSLAECLS